MLMPLPLGYVVAMSAKCTLKHMCKKIGSHPNIIKVDLDSLVWIWPLEQCPMYLVANSIRQYLPSIEDISTTSTEHENFRRHQQQLSPSTSPSQFSTATIIEDIATITKTITATIQATRSATIILQISIVSTNQCYTTTTIDNITPHLRSDNFGFFPIPL